MGTEIAGALAEFHVENTDRTFSICFRRFERTDVCGQMDRAVNFIKALKDWEGLTPRSLLIVGGGVAGITAATAALNEDIEILLLERSSHAFSLQSNCGRFIYPYLYRWPFAAWKMHRYEPEQDRLEDHLPWSAGPAREVAKDWSDHLKIRHEKFKSRVTFTYESEDFSAGNNLEELLANVNDGNRHLYFGAILFALGPQAERYKIDQPAYEGISFWSDDDYENLIPSDTSEWIVSGGGDSALQDYIRMATGGPIHQLAGLLIDRSDGPYHAAIAQLQTHLGHENQRQCASIVRNFIDQDLPRPIWDEWKAIIASRIKKVPYLLVKKPRLSSCFALNAVLVMAIDQWNVDAGQPSRIMYSSDITKIEPPNGDDCSTVGWTTNGVEYEKKCAKLAVRHGLTYYS